MEIVFIVMNDGFVVNVYNDLDEAYHFLDHYPDEWTQIIVKPVLED